MRAGRSATSTEGRATSPAPGPRPIVSSSTRAIQEREPVTAVRSIGGREVSAIGLGAAGFSVGPHPPEADAIDTIHAALDAGVTLIDSAACYVPSHETPGHNEA